MKTVGVVKSPRADTSFIDKIIETLDKRGIRVIDEINETADFVLVLGGDGTILRAAKSAALLEKPIYGINLGRVGYLSDVGKERCFDGLEKVLNDNYFIDKRMMIECRENAALNEICVTRKTFGNIIGLELYINDEFISLFRGDGILISTPTGSTAYNLSAGGPVIKPDAEILAVTAICPQTSHVKSIVVSACDAIKILPEKNKNPELICTFDGRDSFLIDTFIDNYLEIRRSRYYTSIIRTDAKGILKL
jgi:NAD+ kinase